MLIPEQKLIAGTTHWCHREWSTDEHNTCMNLILVIQFTGIFLLIWLWDTLAILVQVSSRIYWFVLTDYHVDNFMHALPLGVTSLIQTQNIQFILSISIPSLSHRINFWENLRDTKKLFYNKKKIITMEGLKRII